MINKKSFNRVFLVGHVGGTPETRYTKAGSAVSTFSLATHELKKTASEEEKEHTEWHNILAWGNMGEFAEQYIKKGQLICIEGSIYTRKWTDKKGVIHSIAEIFANSAVPLEWKK